MKRATERCLISILIILLLLPHHPEKEAQPQKKWDWEKSKKNLGLKNRQPVKLFYRTRPTWPVVGNSVCSPLLFRLKKPASGFPGRVNDQSAVWRMNFKLDVNYGKFCVCCPVKRCLDIFFCRLRTATI